MCILLLNLQTPVTLSSYKYPLQNACLNILLNDKPYQHSPSFLLSL